MCRAIFSIDLRRKSMQYLINGLIAGGVYALFALGFSLLYAAARFFNFAHATVYTFSAFAAYTLHVGFGLSIVSAALLAIAAAGVLSGALELLVFSVLRRRGASDVGMLLASLGIFAAGQGVISIIYGDMPRSIRASETRDSLVFFGAMITEIQIATLSASIVILIGMMWWLYRTRTGQRIRAIADDRELSVIVGIRPGGLMPAVFAVGGLLAGVSAILAAFDLDITSGMGFRALLTGVVATVVGGVGNVGGTVIAAYMLGLIHHLSGAVVAARWQDGITFAVLLAFLAVRPQGLADFQARAWDS